MRAFNDDADRTHPVKVHKITLIVVDHDQLGEDQVWRVLEHAHYPNDCMSPIVVDSQTVEIQYHDQHPINITTRMRAAAVALFDTPEKGNE